MKVLQEFKILNEENDKKLRDPNYQQDYGFEPNTDFGLKEMNSFFDN